MSVETLQYAESFANVAIVNKHLFRATYQLPPDVFLNILNTALEGASPENPVVLGDEADGGFLVTNYLPRAEYANGVTTYLPSIRVDQDRTSGILDFGVRIQSATDEFPYKTFMYNRIDPEKSNARNYLLSGLTTIPKQEVAARIAQHERLVKFGCRLVDLMIAHQPNGKDFSDYKVYRLKG